MKISDSRFSQWSDWIRWEWFSPITTQTVPLISSTDLSDFQQRFFKFWKHCETDWTKSDGTHLSGLLNPGPQGAPVVQYPLSLPLALEVLWRKKSGHNWYYYHKLIIMIITIIQDLCRVKIHWEHPSIYLSFHNPSIPPFNHPSIHSSSSTINSSVHPPINPSINSFIHLLPK